MAEIRLERIGRVFGDGSIGLESIDIETRDGEFLVLVGPSGSGKSTLLRIVAGLDRPTYGRVWIAGTDVTDAPPQQRNVAMVFQSYALYPHRTVRQNLAFGLRMRGASAATIQERVTTVARLLDLEPFLDRRPAQLSGGQRQRVALGRAIVREPAAFLLDEPLSNLDPALRVQTRTELARLQRRLGATIVYVTHDQEEAMTLGHRVAVLRDGRLQQVAPPMELYQRPANAFVAGFIGSPAMNLIPCMLEPGGAGCRMFLVGLELELEAAVAEARSQALLGIRPQDVELSEVGVEKSGTITGAVELVEHLGGELLLHVAIGTEAAKTDVRVQVRADRDVAPGQRVRLRLPPERLHWFGAEGERLKRWTRPERTL